MTIFKVALKSTGASLI